MTLWKINEKHMNCMVTEEEIKVMGYDLEELQTSQDKTREFLDALLENGKNLLELDISEGIKSFNATYLQNNTLFLSISCAEPEEEIDKSLDEIKEDMEEIFDMTSKDNIDRIKELKGEEKANEYSQFVEKLKTVFQNHNHPVEQVEVQFDSLRKNKQMSYNIKFDSLDSVIDFSHIFTPGKEFNSSLFKENDAYYLITDFEDENMADEANKFLLNAQEFGGQVESNPFLKSVMEEHGNCIVKDYALKRLANL